MKREEEIRQSARKYFDGYMDGLKGEVLTVQQTFEDAAKWADKTMIEKACKWLNNELFEENTAFNIYYANDVKSASYDTLDQFIESFKKAMEL